jgi:hypothetical protein
MHKVRQQKFALRIALFVLLKNGFPQPKKRHVLNFIYYKRLLSFPHHELTWRSFDNHDEIWKNDIAWRRKDLSLDGEIDSPEVGHWRLTPIGIAKIEQQKRKWLGLESKQQRDRVLAGFDYWTEELILWMLKIANDRDLSLSSADAGPDTPLHSVHCTAA